MPSIDIGTVVKIFRLLSTDELSDEDYHLINVLKDPDLSQCLATKVQAYEQAHV